MAVDLRKVQAEAPHMVSLVKSTMRVSLDKGLDPRTVKAAVLATFDDSGSARGLYLSGEMQKVADLAFAAGLVFDDDGSVPVSFFNNSVADLGNITLGNCSGFIARQNPAWGGTSYVAALNWIIDAAGYSNVNLGSNSGGGFFQRRNTGLSLSVKAVADYPVFAMVFTDGDPQDGEAASSLLVRMSQLPIFVQFVGVGPAQFTYLEKLDKLDGRLVDNAGFFAARDAGGATEGMLKGLLNEFPGYIPAARKAGLIR